MRRLFLCVGLGLAVASVALAQTEPTWFQPGPGGVPLPPNPDACWSEPPDLEGYLISSEVISIYGLETEVADDFTLDADRTITKVRWWGGYYNNVLPCEPGMTPLGFYLRFYESNDQDCLPWMSPEVEVFVSGSAGETSIGCQQEMRPLYAYEASVSVPHAGATRYWLSVQMADHDFPPQWGRLAAEGIVGCESAFFVNWGYPEWVPVYAVTGVHLDMSQELECDEPVAVQDRSWGRIKAQYR